MPDATSQAGAEYDLLCRELPEPLVQAIELCALPHTLDDDLGYQIIHEFAHLNGAAKGTWADLKQLPFVYPYEEEQWRFAQPARTHFIARLERHSDVHLELHQYLTDYFREERKRIQQPDSPQARELEWRVAYHLAPVAPEEAVERLRDFGEKAARSNRLADVKSVLDVFEEQTRWLSAYQVERAYFEGRYAYAKHNYTVAENRFDLVWKQSRDDYIKAVSGHLLGVIWARRSEYQWLLRAEKIMRASLELGIQIGDIFQQAMVLNSLGGVLIDLGGRARLEEAEQLYRRSLELRQQLSDRYGEAMVLNSLGGVLVKLGGRYRMEEAEQLYRHSLELRQRLDDRQGEAMVLNSLGGVLGKLGGRYRMEEAERDYRRSLEIGEQLGMQRHQSMVLNSLGGVLVKLGGRYRMEEAEQLYRRSQEIEQRLEDRHGEAKVLNSLGGVLVKLGGEAQLQEAEQLYRRSLDLLQLLGDRHGESMVLTNLGGVLVKLGGEAQLQEAEQLYEHSLELEQRLGSRRGEAMVLQGMASLAEARGDIAQACQYIEQVISIEETLRNQYFVDVNRRRLAELQRKLKDQ
jgi:tetratricopeptide (TPR) repeat protein